MASKAKHAKRSKYSSHTYKPFGNFIRIANIKEFNKAQVKAAKGMDKVTEE